MLKICRNEIEQLMPCSPGWHRLSGCELSHADEHEEIKGSALLKATKLEDVLWCLSKSPKGKELFIDYMLWIIETLALEANNTDLNESLAAVKEFVTGKLEKSDTLKLLPSSQLIHGFELRGIEYHAARAINYGAKAIINMDDRFAIRLVSQVQHSPVFTYQKLYETLHASLDAGYLVIKE